MSHGTHTNHIKEQTPDLRNQNRARLSARLSTVKGKRRVMNCIHSETKKKLPGGLATWEECRPTEPQTMVTT